ncbi:hypothetical protein [Nocardia sp. CA-119907]
MSSSALFDAAAAEGAGALEWHAIEEGVGPPLVLLHGLGDTSRAWEP